MYNMINMINTDLCYIQKLMVHPKGSHQKQTFFSFFNVVSRASHVVQW